MVWQTTVICLFMSSFFSEINSSFPKSKNNTPHNRMKQHLEGRMLRDRWEAFISDHLLQELPQDANNDLENSQWGAVYLCFGCDFGFQSYSQELIECLGVVQWSLIHTCLMANSKQHLQHIQVCCCFNRYISVFIGISRLYQPVFWLFICKFENKKHVNVNEQTTNNLAVWGASPLPIILWWFQLSVKSHH